MTAPVIERRMDWFVLAFGHWARCRPGQHNKRMLMRRRGTEMDPPFEGLERMSWDEDTDPG